MFEKAKK